MTMCHCFMELWNLLLIVEFGHLEIGVMVTVTLSCCESLRFNLCQVLMSRYMLARSLQISVSNGRHALRVQQTV